MPFYAKIRFLFKKGNKKRKALSSLYCIPFAKI